jgi:hypothetical protein
MQDQQVIMPLTKFNVSPLCPYFFIYAIGIIPTVQSADHSTDSSPAFQTDFTFLNGSTIVSTRTLIWGDAAAIKTQCPQPSVQFLEMGVLATKLALFFDTYSEDIDGGPVPMINSMGYGIPVTWAEKWTAVCDSITAQTKVLAPWPGVYTVAFNPVQLVQGMLQQPWT